MDEVLLSSVVEACVRIGQPELLESKLMQLQSGAVAITGSHTYGSLIKAYGHARDIDGIWRCWREMRSRHIKPTSITVGCMVEAIVSNGDSEGAFGLIHQLQDDEECSSSLNSVIYCSVLKGFTREKKVEQVWQVYEEMLKRNVEVSTITYNTLIDACARCGRMEWLTRILEDMKTQKINPNIITYSTMLKGHCQNGDMPKAFAIFKQLKEDEKMQPDEIMYNSLLDGCAQNSMVQEGMQLLEEMQVTGVSPSNFTLSILVKLMSRARKVDQAFQLVEGITRKYKFRPNVHVYTNLIQACASGQQLSRGMKILEQMMNEQIVPDSRTYAILMRTSLLKGMCEQAAGLMKGALGLSDALPFLRTATAICPNLDYSLVSEILGGLVDRGHAEDMAKPLLLSIKQNKPRVRIDRAVEQKVNNPAASAPWNANSMPYRSGGYRSGKGKGKGH